MSHQRCGDAGAHICQVPSGRKCVDCGKPAGTKWGPYWCPACDQIRLDRITEGMEEIMRQQAGWFS
jgi:Zn finger protein HypA/HybF involved in hydrogenase expression